MKLVKPTYINLQLDPRYSEQWLQEQLLDDITLLGLGDLDVRDSERMQPGAGRLDLLLTDSRLPHAL